jgi:hypothetical protein
MEDKLRYIQLGSTKVFLYMLFIILLQIQLETVRYGTVLSPRGALFLLTEI